MTRSAFSAALGFLLLLVAVTGHAASPAAQTDAASASQPELKLARFDIDATPPVGYRMSYDTVIRVDALGLRCRGIAILGAGQPIVLCSVDWLGIANESHDVMKAVLAKAAGTTADRVAVHTVHQHDAPRADSSAERIMHEAGISEMLAFDGSLFRDLLRRLKPAVTDAIAAATPITHAGFASAVVEKVASNRRILDDTGKVQMVRFSAAPNPKIRAAPEGTIDPELSSLAFWNQDKPVAVLTFYACHPQSYYRTGVPSTDFPGIARLMREQDVPNTLHVHFAGAGGNIGAGKYNDGKPKNRMTLAGRLAEGMETAFENTKPMPISAKDIRWTVVPVRLPLAPHLADGPALSEVPIENEKSENLRARPRKRAWIQRCQSGHEMQLACLGVGDARVLFMPGELFVEYQLAAKAMAPDLQVAMAAYGDLGTSYIGTKVAYGQGGYETSQVASNVAPECEEVLMDGIRKLLEKSTGESE